MTSRTALTLVLPIVLGACGPVELRGGDGACAPETYDFSAVDTFLTQSIALFDGNVLVMILKDGAPIYQFQLGAIGPDTVVRMASATKLISAGVILSVVDSGNFALDDRVGDYVPAMQAAGKGDITIRQCFSMTSGLFGGLLYEINPLLTLEQSVDRIAQFTPIVFPPGTQMAYDGAGMQVAGLAAQNATGVGWRLLAAQRIFAPLQMASTSYTEFGLNPAVAGGVRTSANDYLRYLQMVLDGGVWKGQRILSPEAIAEIFTNQSYGLPIYHLPPGFAGGSPWFPYGAETIWYGFGAWVLARNPVSGRVEEITSPGAWGSFAWIDRRRGIVGMLVTDVPAGSAQAVDPALHAFELIRQAIDRAVLGDLNCDGCIDFEDIEPFVVALAGEAAYEQAYPSCRHLQADCNRDGGVDFADVDAFVAQLARG